PRGPRSPRRGRARSRGPRRGSAGPLCAVALLVLLARPAPARVVAAELLVLVHAALLDHRRRGVRLVGLDAVALAAVGARLLVLGPAGVVQRGRAPALLLLERGVAVL